MRMAIPVIRFWCRSCGCSARKRSRRRFDMEAAGRREDWALWMLQEIRAADLMLVVGSAEYKRRSEVMPVMRWAGCAVGGAAAA